MWASPKDRRPDTPAQQIMDAAANSAADWDSLRYHEKRAEQTSTMIALVMLAIGLFSLVVWAEMRPGVPDCMEMETMSARTACFEQLRHDNQQPAKGATAPPVSRQAE